MSINFTKKVMKLWNNLKRQNIIIIVILIILILVFVIAPMLGR